LRDCCHVSLQKCGRDMRGAPHGPPKVLRIDSTIGLIGGVTRTYARLAS
jgi:hypothetical protein